MVNNHGVIAQRITHKGKWEYCGKKKGQGGGKISDKYTEFWDFRGPVIRGSGTDTWSSVNRVVCTKGELTIKGDARLIDGGALPANVVSNPNHPSSGLPHVPNKHVSWPKGKASKSLKRTLKITWDCCNGNKNPTVIVKYP